MSLQIVAYLMRKAKELYTYKQGEIFQPEDKYKDTTRYFACDTEVAYLDIKSESPVRVHNENKRNWTLHVRVIGAYSKWANQSHKRNMRE